MKWSIATGINLYSLLAFRLIDLIISIPYIVNGYGDVKLNRETGGALILSLYT
jgi:hypothetical protein